MVVEELQLRAGYGEFRQRSNIYEPSYTLVLDTVAMLAASVVRSRQRAAGNEQQPSNLTSRAPDVIILDSRK